MSDNLIARRARTLDDLLSQEYGVNTHIGPESIVVSVLTTRTPLVSNNPNRVGLTFMNIGVAPIVIWFLNTVAAGNGFLLAANGGSLALDWRVDFALLGYDWYGISPGGPSNLQIAEVITK